MTFASMAPEPTTPSARELAAGPATRVAITLATAQNAPVANAVRNRAASSNAKLEPARRRLRVQEHETRPVGRLPAAPAEQRGVQDAAELVGAERIEPAVLGERRRGGHRVKHPLDARTDRLRGKPRRRELGWLARARSNRCTRSAKDCVAILRS